MKMDNKQFSILLVDDEPGIRKILSLALADKGFGVTAAGDARQAMTLMDDHHFQIVLTDIKMPGIDGIELLKAIKKTRSDIEVIMMTGHGDMDLAIQSLKFGAMDFITKPINETMLDMALQRAGERLIMRAQLAAYTQKLEQLVEEKSRQLVDAERLAAIGETVAGLSHSIKNIAAGLRGGAFVVEKGIELDKRQYLLEGWHMVRSNVEKIGRLSLDLLNYAKTATMACQWCDPNTPIEEIVDLLSPRAEEEAIELDIQLAASAESAFFDPDAIHRALLNLVTNAMDACLDRKNAKVGLHVSVGKDGCIDYRIKDNGCGMDATVRRKLFQTFFSTKGDKGNGIGLMMTRNIIEKHGGTIQFNSQSGKGTEFVVSLPAPESSGKRSTHAAASIEEAS